MFERREWCCPGFEAAFGAAGRRGIGVRLASSGTGFKVFVQMRCADFGKERAVRADTAETPITLVEDVPISFCPWCGRKLTFYKSRAQSMIRPELDQY